MNKMPVSGNPQWRSRLSAMGIDPDIGGRGFATTLATYDLHQYFSWWDPPKRSATKASVLDGRDLNSISDERGRRAIEEHLLGISPITDSAVIQALQDRFRVFTADVIAAPDITITAANPLIINSTQTITVFGNVTLQDGGYIQITVPCSFECVTFTKTQTGGGTAPAYDITVAGATGATGTVGTPGNSPAGQAAAGSDGACDCCGGIAENNGTDGAVGAAGGPGLAGQPGANGGDAPQMVVLQLGTLTGTVSLLNQGGTGGAGGAGGAGGVGQQGGDGGSDKTCGAEHCDGGSGGVGGVGGQGGNGGQGANGGAGAQIQVSYTGSGQVLATNGTSPGGGGGAAGQGGAGGAGGASGGRGAVAGAAGNPGTNGVAGIGGIGGTLGAVTING